MRGHTLERLQTRTMPTGDLDSSFDDRSRNVATGEPQLGPPQIRGVSPMESTAELPGQAVLDSSGPDSRRRPSSSGENLQDLPRSHVDEEQQRQTEHRVDQNAGAEVGAHPLAAIV